MPGRRRRPTGKTPTARSKAEPGEVRNGRVYLPDHPLARPGGWVLEHRAKAYMDRNGVCVCDAGKTPMDWAAAKVVDAGANEWLVLCQSHAALRWFAGHLDATGFGGSDGKRLAVELGALWRSPCPPQGGLGYTEDRQDFMEPPIGGVHGGQPTPDHQVEVST